MKTILILTASFGEGHNAAARNLSEAIADISPETTVQVRDVFLEAYGKFNQLCAQGYLGIINHFPRVWQKAYEVLDRTTLVEQQIGIYRAAARILEETLETMRPDVVVSTYPGCNHLLDHICRRRVRRPFRTVTVVTDSITINSVWYRAHSDTYIAANAATAEILREAGVPSKRIQALGFPVPRIFATLQGLRAAPPKDGRWKVLYVINSGRQIAPEIVRQLLTIKNINLGVTVGRDEELHRTLVKVVGDHPVTIHGWIPNLPQLMAESHVLISKAGGATVQEALAATTPMIITQIVPGQEEGNARLLIESGAGALATTPETVTSTVNEIFANDGSLWKEWHHATRELSHPDAADRIAEFVLGQDSR